jgi:hypothetical protein
MRSWLKIFALTVVLGLVSDASVGDIIEFEDKDEWEAAAGPLTTIDFTGFESGTIITTQYIDLGVLFTDGDDTIHPGDYFQDDWGLAGHEATDVVFMAPMNVLAVDFPGSIIIELYAGGDLFYSNGFGAPGEVHFAGIVSTDPFDHVIFHRENYDFVFMDDLHFGPPIPTAPVVVPFAFAAVTTRRRRA